MSKRYGLIVPGKNGSTAPPKADFTKPSIFGSDSDSDDNAPILKRTVTIGPGNAEKRQARRLQEKALKEDPTVFQYDEVYDEIENKRDEERKTKTQEVKKPKYIGRLLECAERRKLENERRIERMVQKEREQEGDQYKDKDSFVTAAYRKKLEELKRAEEREKREEYLEAIGDVTKQQDLGGFYRHLYEQKLGPKTVEEQREKSITPPLADDKTDKNNKTKQIKARAYRKRKASDEDEIEDSSQTNDIASKKAHLQSNIDADSDFSIDSSSESDKEEKAKIPTTEKVVESVNNISEPVKDEKLEKEDVEEVSEITNNVQATEIKSEKDDDTTQNEEEKPVEKKPKKDIWKKRTVGEVFESALQRYYERKAAKNG